MDDAFQASHLTKRFREVDALREVTLSIPPGQVVGLIGRNGSGKTTLLRHAVGLLLPTSGQCHTLGCPTEALGPVQLARIGFVPQENRFLSWMTVRQHLAYVASFYDAWDHARQKRLLDELELDPRARIARLSPGNAQKLAVLLAICHHPDLLLLDEPVSALDPIARESLLAYLLEMVAQDELTIVVSSHVLRDIERVVNWIVCLEEGSLVENASLDDLQERYAEWNVTSTNGGLPARFEEQWVVAHSGDARAARLFVREASGRVEAFQKKYHAEVNERRVNLERMFPLLVGENPR